MHHKRTHISTHTPMHQKWAHIACAHQRVVRWACCIMNPASAVLILTPVNTALHFTDFYSA